MFWRATARRRLRIPVEHDHLLGGQERSFTERGTRDLGVLGWHEVRMRPGGALRGEPQHLGPECGEHHLVVGNRWRGCVQLHEVVDHLAERSLIRLSAPLDGRGVADAEAEQEASRVGRRQLRMTRRDFAGFVHPHVQDAGGDDGTARRAEQPA